MATVKFISDVTGEVASFNEANDVAAWLASDDSLSIDGTLYAIYDDGISSSVILFDIDSDMPKQSGDTKLNAEFPDKQLEILVNAFAKNSVFRHIPRKELEVSLAS